MAAPKKSPQILDLEPAEELVFEGPFDRVVTSYLELKNPSDYRVCFKVKTTAPHRYGVRPNSGVIAPAGKIRVAIMFHPTEKDTQSDRARHKFMVQSIILRSDITPTDTFWKEAKPEDIMDSKLRCIFRHAESGLETRDAPSAAAAASQQPKQQQPQQPPAAATTPQQQQQQQAVHSPQKTSTTQQQSVTQQQQSATKPQRPANKVISSSSDGEPSWNETNTSLDTTRDLANLNRPMLVLGFIMFIVGVILGKYII